MSDMPSGPGARPKSSVCASHDRDGRDSAALVFTAPPRFTGADHGSLGGKVNGAGGDGGSVTLLLGPDGDRTACTAALAAAGFAVFPARPTEWGVRTWEEPDGADAPAPARQRGEDR